MLFRIVDGEGDTIDTGGVAPGLRRVIEHTRNRVEVPHLDRNAIADPVAGDFGLLIAVVLILGLGMRFAYV